MIAQLRDQERALLRGALDSSGWNAARAGKELGISEGAVRKMIKRHGLAFEYRERSAGRGRPRKPKAK